MWLAAADPSHVRRPDEGAAAARAALALALQAKLAREAAIASAWLCVHLFRQGKLDEACEAVEAALPRLAGNELLDERCETLRIQAVAHCERGRFAVALEAAYRLIAEAAMAGSTGWSLMGAYALGACYDRLGDPWQGARVLGEAMLAHPEGGTPRQRLICHIGMCAYLGDSFHRMRDALPADEARERLLRARPHAEAALRLVQQSPEPLFQVAAHGNYGEVLLHLGDLQGAQPHLEDSMRIAAEVGLVAHGRRARASWCEWLLAMGRTGDALATVRALLAELGDSSPPHILIRAQDAAYKACRQLGQYEEALGHLAAFEQLERRRTVGQLRALGELFVTRGELVGLSQRADASEARSLMDPLTGLGNRRLLFGRATSLGADDVLAMIDIDHFKQINDQHGHLAGDAVLVRLAALLHECTRASDLAVRFGGEEFVLLLRGTGRDAAHEVCRRLHKTVEATERWPELPAGTRITISIGLAAAQGGSLQDVLSSADAALYRAKHDGRNRIVMAG